MKRNEKQKFFFFFLIYNSLLKQIDINTKIPSHVCVDHKAHGLKSWLPPEFFQMVFFLFNFFSPFWIMYGAIFIPTLPPPPFLTSTWNLTVPKVTIAHYKISRT